MKPLRGYQADAIHMLRQSLRSGKMRPVLQMPTGSGKTRTAAEIINLSRAKGNRYALFIVPRISLIDQTVEAFWAEGIHDIGVLQGDHPLTKPTAAVQVASVQTLPRRRLPPASIVIADEVHMRSEWLVAKMASPEWARTPVIGLSATPWTAGMGQVWDDLIVPVTMAELIDQGRLAPFRVYAPSHPDLSAVKTVAGDYHEGQLSEVMSGLTADAVTTWLAKGEGRPTLAFCVKRADARKLCEAFNAAGVPAEYADAYTDRLERTAIGERLRTGETKVLTNVGIATTGVDLPWVSCLILARPTQSPALFVQICGRALRKHPEGCPQDSIILDHTDTALRLGLPTEIHYEALDDGKPDKSGKKKKKKDKQQLPKECPSCKALKPAGVHVCPSCGFAPMKQSDMEFADGELRELTRDAGSMAMGEGIPQHERMRWYAMLKWWCTSKGYKPMWLSKSYAEKFGMSVGRDIDRGCRPLYPDDDVRNWLRSRAIAYAKAQKKAA